MILLTGHGEFAKEFLNQEKAKIISLRNADEKDLITQIKKACSIVHNAADLTCKSLTDCVSNNFYQTKYLLDLILKVNPDTQFIYLSSMSILSSDDKYSDVLAMTPYAYSKYLAETYCRKYPLKRFICVRFSTLFYKDLRRDGLSKLIYDAVMGNTCTLIDNGEDKRDFLPLPVAVNYVRKIIRHFPHKETVMNIASGKETSFRDIAYYLKKKIPSLSIRYKKQKISSKVLSSFNPRSINRLGRIDFSLEKEIDDYIYKLQDEKNDNCRLW